MYLAKSQFLICDVLSFSVNSQSFLKIYLVDSTDPQTAEDTLKEGKSDWPHPWERINPGLYNIWLTMKSSLFSVKVEGYKENQNV